MSTQIFAIQLLSYLCTQYALPKSLSVARLAISVMGTLLTGESTVFLVSASHTFMLVVVASFTRPTTVIYFPSLILLPADSLYTVNHNAACILYVLIL